MRSIWIRSLIYSYTYVYWALRLLYNDTWGSGAPPPFFLSLFCCAVIQFEDFSSDKASDILEAYRYDHLCFNDDIQGEIISQHAKVAQI